MISTAAAQRISWVQLRTASLTVGHVQGGLVAGAIGVGLTVDTIHSWQFPAYATLIVWALLLGTNRGPRVASVLVGVVAVAVLFLAPSAAAWGSEGSWTISVMFTATAIGLALYLVPRASIDRALEALVYVYVTFAASVYVDSLIGAHDRARGFSFNPNPVAGTLVVGIAYGIATRRWWLVAALIAPLMLTGSRAATLVMIALVLGSLVARRMPLRSAAWICLATVVLLAPTYQQATVALRVNPANPISSITNGVEDLVERDVTDQPAASFHLLPRGGSLSDTRTHFTPWRVLLEIGVLGGSAWILLVLIALRRSIGTVHGLMLATASLLTLVDVYFWMPVNATGLFWLLVAAGVKPREVQQ